MISSSSAYKLAAKQLITYKDWSGKPFGMLLVLLRCLLGGSWGLLRSLWRLLGCLGSLLGPLGKVLAASWRLLGAYWVLLGRLGRLLGLLGRLLGASWGGLWPILAALERSLAGPGVVLEPLWRKSGPGCSGSTILGAPRGGSLAEKWPWLEREQDFQGSQKSTAPFGRASGVANPGDLPPPKAFR